MHFLIKRMYVLLDKANMQYMKHSRLSSSQYGMTECLRKNILLVVNYLE